MAPAMSRGWLRGTTGALLVAGLATLVGVSAAAARRPPADVSSPTAHAAYAQQCPDPYPAIRNPGNPLDLPAAPGSNPLSGAKFFVDGPRHGEAAGAIAQLLGLNPDRFSDSYSWTRFEASLGRGRLHRKLEHNHALARKVALLETIADGPEAQRSRPNTRRSTRSCGCTCRGQAAASAMAGRRRGPSG